MPNIKLQNDLRINLSSFKKILNYDKIFNLNENKFITKFNNKKIININNFELEFGLKKIKYSTFYTNPYVLEKKILSNISFEKTKNYLVNRICKKIFFHNIDLSELENIYLNNLIKKNKSTNKFIEFEQSLLTTWYIIYFDKCIGEKEKEYMINFIKYYYIKFSLNKFDFGEIINYIFNDTNLLIKKINFSLYVLMEEFHFKYIIAYLNVNFHANDFYNSNYIKINPQNILNNCNDQCEYTINELNEEISNPFGHNILFIKTNMNKKNIYYYDPDEIVLEDFYKFKFLFKTLRTNLFNISNRKPIQTITDDANCVFYCLGLVKYIFHNYSMNILNFSNLKKNVLFYENYLISNKINIFDYLNF